MTIAAGFLYQDGVLLCADTELTGWSMKLNDTKLGYIDRGDITVGVACAGNTAFSVAAMQKCFRALSDAPVEEFLGIIERTLEREYRKVVYRHPNQGTDPGLQYWHLVAMGGGGETGLYLTEQATIREVHTYACIGLGEAFAHQLLSGNFRPDMRERDALSLASWVVGNVKSRVPGCGGATQFLIFRKDGTMKSYESTVGVGGNVLTTVEWVERYQSKYARMCQKLFFKMADPQTTTEDFEHELEEFAKEARELRSMPSGPNVRRLHDLIPGGD